MTLLDSLAVNKSKEKQKKQQTLLPEHVSTASTFLWKYTKIVRGAEERGMGVGVKGCSKYLWIFGMSRVDSSDFVCV